MTITLWLGILASALLAVAAYRLGLADGISTVRRGRLAGGKAEHPDHLLEKIDAYHGRKGAYDTNKRTDLA